VSQQADSCDATRPKTSLSTVYRRSTIQPKLFGVIDVSLRGFLISALGLSPPSTRLARTLPKRGLNPRGPGRQQAASILLGFCLFITLRVWYASKLTTRHSLQQPVSDTRCVWN